MIFEIKRFIEEKIDFIIGGRGIGIECYKMDQCWQVKIERARFATYPDVITIENDDLCLYDNTYDGWYGKFDLKHYLKVTKI